jgi:hypothetical protein
MNKPRKTKTGLWQIRVTDCQLSGPRCSDEGDVVSRASAAKPVENEQKASKRRDAARLERGKALSSA